MINVGGPPPRDGLPGEAKKFRHLDLRVPNSQPRRARNRSDWRTSSDNCLASGNEMAMARHPFSTATQMVTYPIGRISEQLACRRNMLLRTTHR